MGASQSQTLFFEHAGKLVGPFSHDELIARIQSGGLAVEARVFDSAKNAWTTAADIVPVLNFAAGADKTQSSISGWQAPAKPIDLSNTHVVDLNKVRTEGIDYFALISDRKKEAEREREFAKNSERQLGKKAGTGWAAPQMAAKAMAREITLTLKKVFRSSKAGKKVVAMEEHKRSFLAEHRTQFLVAASLAFVFGGTFEVVKSLNEKTQREPAAATPVKAAPAATTPFLRPRKTQTPAPLGSVTSEIGNGNNPWLHASGSAGARQRMSAENRIAPLAQPQTPPPSAPQPPTANANSNDDGPLFYSSAPPEQPTEQQPPPVMDNTVTTPGNDANEQQAAAPPNIPLPIPMAADSNTPQQAPQLQPQQQAPQDDSYRTPGSEAPATQEAAPNP